jgi:hypothetical protein
MQKQSFFVKKLSSVSETIDKILYFLYEKGTNDYELSRLNKLANSAYKKIKEKTRVKIPDSATKKIKFAFQSTTGFFNKQADSSIALNIIERTYKKTKGTIIKYEIIILFAATVTAILLSFFTKSLFLRFIITTSCIIGVLQSFSHIYKKFIKAETKWT